MNSNSQMYVIKSTKDNSYYEGPDTIGDVVFEAYSFQEEDAKQFPSMEEAREVQKSLLDQETVITPVKQPIQVNYFDALDGL